MVMPDSFSRIVNCETPYSSPSAFLMSLINNFGVWAKEYLLAKEQFNIALTKEITTLPEKEKIQAYLKKIKRKLEKEKERRKVSQSQDRGITRVANLLILNLIK